MAALKIFDAYLFWLVMAFVFTIESRRLDLGKARKILHGTEKAAVPPGKSGNATDSSAPEGKEEEEEANADVEGEGEGNGEGNGEDPPTPNSEAVDANGEGKKYVDVAQFVKDNDKVRCCCSRPLSEWGGIASAVEDTLQRLLTHDGSCKVYRHVDEMKCGSHQQHTHEYTSTGKQCMILVQEAQQVLTGLLGLTDDEASRFLKAAKDAATTPDPAAVSDKPGAPPAEAAAAAPNAAPNAATTPDPAAVSDKPGVPPAEAAVAAPNAATTPVTAAVSDQPGAPPADKPAAPPAAAPAPPTEAPKSAAIRALPLLVLLATTAIAL